MVDHDLPEPKERNLTTPQQKEERLFSVLYSLTVFAVLYSSIHKLWIPLFLKFTSVSQLSYQEVDFWIVPAFAFWGHLRRHRNLSWFGTFLCGTLIVHGVFEMWFISEGKYFGWLEISHLLSAAPLALLSIGWLSLARDRKPQPIAGWAGVFLSILISVASSYDFRNLFLGGPKTEDAQQEIRLEFNPGVPRLQRADECGQQAFWVSLVDYPNREARTEIQLSKCGLAPAMSRMDRFYGFSVLNKLPTSANIHILVFRPDGQKRGFNRILRSYEKLELHRGNFNIANDEYLMIYSDSTPGAGITALFPNDQKGLFKVTRTPLQVMPINERTGVAAFVVAPATVLDNSALKKNK